MIAIRVVTALSLLSSFVSARIIDGAAHTPYYGENVKRASSNATTSITLEDYEYVVVGSGAGGAPLAARLALAGHKVLLLEAGSDETNTLQYNVPLLHPLAAEYEPMRWDYFVQHFDDAEEQKRDTKLTYTFPNGSRYTGANPPPGAKPLGVLYPRAGTLGGCTTHNALATVYPHDSDWSYIQNITGDDSWAPANMRKYFERLERAQYLPNSTVGHGFGGWLETALADLSVFMQDPKVISLVISAATATGKSALDSVASTVVGLGELLLRDVNNAGPTRDSDEGLYQLPLAMKTPEDKRAGPVDLLRAVVNAKNRDGSRKYHLDIQLNTLVTKVILDTTARGKPRATGVTFLTGPSLYGADPRRQDGRATSKGKPGSVTASREVIVSAGTFNTPQLLKLSGIGPRDELKKFGIDVKVDLPGVGANLQDRYELPVIGQAATKFSLLQNCTFLQGEDPCLERWETQSDKGIYASDGVPVTVVHKSAVAQHNDSDIFVSGYPAAFNGYYPDFFTNATKGGNHWTWLVLKAHSRNNAGTVTLRSASPQDVPNIRFRSFQVGGDQDLAALLEGLKYGRQAFEDLIPLDGQFTEVWPGPGVQTDEEWRNFAKYEAWGHHASCTCPIGADHDKNAVLDGDFRVRGVDGLRVVDASSFPKIPGFYIVLPLYMMSEKASDVILADVKH